jgi:hypothetical protein
VASACDPTVTEYGGVAGAVQRNPVKSGMNGPFVHRKLISTSKRYGLRPLIHSRLVFGFESGSLRSWFCRFLK